MFLNRFIQSGQCMLMQPQQSLPTFGRKCVVLQGNWGADETHLVDDHTLHDIRAVIMSAERGRRYGSALPPASNLGSTGSLGSHGSAYSSASSLASNTSQTSGFSGGTAR